MPGKTCSPDLPKRTHGRRDAADIAMRDAINAQIGRRIRALRLARGQTQAALGRALGLSNQQIQKYETGAIGLTLERVCQIARQFGVKIEDLLEGLDAAALDATPPGADPLDDFPRLRIELAEALSRVTSRKLLVGILRLVRVDEAERLGLPDDQDG
jgi:transcriptional regulator with XRE-family HTH domain